MPAHLVAVAVEKKRGFQVIIAKLQLMHFWLKEESMSVENVKKFCEQLAADEKLRSKVESISNKISKIDIQKEMMDRSFSLLEPIIKKAGYSFTLKDIHRYETHLKKEALKSDHHSLKSKDYGGCVCVVGGGGYLHDGNRSGSCVCVAAGTGQMTAEDGTNVACACIFGGGGG